MSALNSDGARPKITGQKNTEELDLTFGEEYLSAKFSL